MNNHVRWNHKRGWKAQGEMQSPVDWFPLASGLPWNSLSRTELQVDSSVALDNEMKLPSTVVGLDVLLLNFIKGSCMNYYLSRVLLSCIALL